MTKHFTTPEFTDLLKQYGIEIATPFYRYFDIVSPTVDRIGIDCQYGMLDINSRYIAEGQEVCEPKPAYLLSEALTWLPEEILNGYYLYGEVTNGIQFWGYADDNHRGGLYWKIESKPIEQLITQGLTEGWLTKEIIEQQIKDNQ